MGLHMWWTINIERTLQAYNLYNFISSNREPVCVPVRSMPVPTQVQYLFIATCALKLIKGI